MKRLTLWLGAVVLATSASCMAGTSKEGPTGAIALTVRLPDPGQKLLYVQEVIPVEPGPLTLYYPKWIPGDHSPDGTVETLPSQDTRVLLLRRRDADVLLQVGLMDRQQVKH